MRWGNLLSNEEPAGIGEQGALFGLDAVSRTFDTPEFAGMTFYEVRAKSIVNRVPGESRVPFRWTVNPYRGCTHACVYCLAGDTRILMADGSTKPLAFVDVDDAIIGTVPGPDSTRRQAVVTHVRAHWSTVKTAYRITLHDGRTLIASGDHRFLSDKGWRRVTGERPHLRDGTVLLGCSPPAPGTRAEMIGQPITPAAGGVVMAIEQLGPERAMYDITTGTGDFIANGIVSHNCFARRTHEYLDLDAGADFDSKVIVKVNAPELLRKELRRPSWVGEPIAMGTNVDCYQRAEGRYALMPGIIGALRDARNPFSILTKGTLVTRDLDLLCEAAEVTDVGVSVSVGFTDRELWRKVEPGTPSPQARLGVCRKFTDAGLGCGVLMAPILPYLSDSPRQLAATVREIAEAGARGVTPIVLHLRPGAREWYFAWLGREYPELVPRYRELYAGGSYAPKAYQRRITERVAALAAEHGIAG